MYFMKELSVVEETKHLVPNLPFLIAALFGQDSYYIPKSPPQTDWFTGKIKIGDGLVYLPWLSQLWLIEVEWKEGSNFSEQASAFAEGKVDKNKLSKELGSTLEHFLELLTAADPDVLVYRKEIASRKIVKTTLENHFYKGSLRPHCWVILGHSRDNEEKLKTDYKKILEAWFGKDKHYILSMARMFCSDFSTYILLEQHCSEGCQEILSVEPSILVPGILATKEQVEEPLAQPSPVEPEETPKDKVGRAAKFWNCLKTSLEPNLTPEDIRLRIKIGQHSAEFKVDWDHEGKELMVLKEGGGHQKPAIAFKTKFSDVVPDRRGNIARRFGEFVDVSQGAPKFVAYYKKVEKDIV